MIDLGKFRTQQIMNAPIAKASPHLCNIDDRGTELHRLLIRRRRVTVTTAGEPHKTARSALGQIKPLDDLPDSFTPDLWGISAPFPIDWYYNFMINYYFDIIIMKFLE